MFFLYLRSKDKRGVTSVQFIHLPMESSALPAEAPVINDRAVVSTQAGWATRATIHFPPSSQSADCCTEKLDVPSKLTLAFIPAWTQLCLTRWGPSGLSAGETNQEELRSAHRAKVALPPERIIQYENPNVESTTARSLIPDTRKCSCEIIVSTASVLSGGQRWGIRSGKKEWNEWKLLQVLKFFCCKIRIFFFSQSLLFCESTDYRYCNIKCKGHWTVNKHTFVLSA